MIIDTDTPKECTLPLNHTKQTYNKNIKREHNPFSLPNNMTVLQNVAKSIGMVAAFGAYPAAATNEFELEQECAQNGATKKSDKTKRSKDWVEKRGYRDSFGHDDEQGKADAKEDAMINDLSK